MSDTSMQERLTRLLGYREHDPQNFPLLVDIAALQLALGQSAEATQSAQQAIALADDKPQGHALLGLIAARANDFAAAVPALERALQLGDDAPAVIYHHAYALAMLERYGEARASAERAAQFADQYPFAPALYIRVLHHLGEIEAAIAFAESLQAAGNSAPRVNGMLSTLYMDDEQFDKARDAAAAALAENDDDADAHTTTGLLALGDLNGEQAQAAFQRVLATQPEHGRALLGQGLGQLLGGDIDAATISLEQTVQASNMRSHLGTWQTLAWCYILRRDLDGAERVLKQALDIDHNFAETHGAMAVVAIMRGNIDSATREIKRANGLDEDNFSAKFAQSLVETVGGNKAQAAQLIEQILTQAKLPDGRPVQAAIAEMLARNESGMNKTIH
jgi:tetratricopeptide (TPR) repeat protein